MSSYKKIDLYRGVACKDSDLLVKPPSLMDPLQSVICVKRFVVISCPPSVENVYKKRATLICCRL